MNSKKGLVLGILLLLGIGFAAVSTTLYLNGNVNIEANNEDFNVKFTKAIIDTEDKTSDSISIDGKSISFTTKELQALNDKSVLDFEVTNDSSLYDAEVSIECTSGEKGEYYQITKEVTNLVSAKTTESGKVEVEKIKMVEEDIEEIFTCTLTAIAVERTTKGKEPVKINQNIVNSDIECLQNSEAGSCAPGTEIRYMVNESLEKTFNVLHDDGDTIVLQDTVNIVSDTIWNDANDNTKGPTAVLDVLENETSGWVNVNTRSYTMGTTIFKDNLYTGCNYDSNGVVGCTTNSYTLDTRSSKARMITVQEAAAVGCTIKENSCPSWMLLDDLQYWTMSARSDQETYAWYIATLGRMGSNITSKKFGARAVVEIYKHQT